MPVKNLFDIQFLELQQAMKPYKKDWNEWTRSSTCFLEKEEIITINKFINTRTGKNGSEEPGMDEISSYIMLKNSITKLTLFLDIFKKYKKLQKSKNRNKAGRKSARIKKPRQS